MKSLFCIAGILYVLVLLVECEIVPEFKSILDECQKEFQLSEESLISPNFEDNKINCFAACVMKKDDRLMEGKISVDKEVATAPKYMAERIDDTLKDKMTECVDKANEEKDDCAVSGAFYKCLIDKFGPFRP